MGSENGGESVELHPAQKKLLAPAVVDERRESDGAVSADVAVVEGVAGDAAAEEPNHGALDPVVGLPAHHLVPFPEQHPPFGAASEPGSHEEHQRLLRSFLLALPLFHELPVYLGPQLRVPVVSRYWIFA